MQDSSLSQVGEEQRACCVRYLRPAGVAWLADLPHATSRMECTASDTAKSLLESESEDATQPEERDEESTQATASWCGSTAESSDKQPHPLVAISAAGTIGIPSTQRDEAVEPDESPSIATNLTTSAALLRELLLLQRRRQREATALPPPDLLIGTKVCTRKAVTTAETLRIKILCARQLERQTRLHQFETTIRQKLDENASRRQHSRSEGVISPRRKASKAGETGPLSPNAELEKRVSLLTTFFHEMAVHHLTDDELNGSAVMAAENAAEERLLKHFGDIFEGDVALQNVLDEEKWSTEAGKAARRRESTVTKLPKTIASAAQHDAEDNRLTFEDYENTARYIEQLMRDVEDHESLRQSQKEVAEAEREREVMAQLVASWEYTQHRIARPATRQRLTEVEQKRRGDWMQSHYVQLPGAVASARHENTPLRPTFIPPKQSFLLEEQSLPSNAVWEVPGSLSNQPASLASGALAAVGLVSPRNVEIASAEEGGRSPGLGRTFQPQRPSTAVKAPLSVDRPGSSTALRSAALSRARVRRIRSAHPYPSNNSAEHTSTTHRGHSAPSPTLPRQVIAEALTKGQEGVCYIPEAFMALPFEPSSHESDESSEESDASPSSEAAGIGICEPAEVLEADSATPVIAGEALTLASPRAVGREDPLMMNTATKATIRKRRVRKKKRSVQSGEVLRFRLSVQELVALTSKVQDAAADERERAEAAVEQASVHFTLPNRPVKTKPRRRDVTNGGR